MATEGAAGLSTTAIEAAIGWCEQGGHPGGVARAELAALVEAAGRAAALAAALAHYAARPTWRDYIVSGGERVECCTGTVYHPDKGAGCPAPGWEVADIALADAGRGAAGARAETALLDAAARYQDAWRVLAAGDATDEEKRAHILDMHEAREDLFDATEVALRAGGAGEGG
jgi:hypothetical protein